MSSNQMLLHAIGRVLVVLGVSATCCAPTTPILAGLGDRKTISREERTVSRSESNPPLLLNIEQKSEPKRVRLVIYLHNTSKKRQFSLALRVDLDECAAGSSGLGVRLCLFSKGGGPLLSLCREYPNDSWEPTVRVLSPGETIAVEYEMRRECFDVDPGDVVVARAFCTSEEVGDETRQEDRTSHATLTVEATQSVFVPLAWR
jgi:hypothetical protein